jgi:hypothetical protein
MKKLNKEQKMMIESYYKINPNNSMIDNSSLTIIENIKWYETAHIDIACYYDDLKIKGLKEKQYNSDYARFKRGEL